MAQSRNIEEFIKNLKFKKKAMGGCDEEDVLIKMKELNDIYREASQGMRDELEKANAGLSSAQAELATVKAQLEESKSRLAESNSQLEESRSQLSEAERQLADTRKQLQEAKAQLAETKERLMDAKERLAGAGERQTMRTLRGGDSCGDSYRRQAVGDLSGAYEDRLEALNKMITSIEGTKEDIIKRARMEAQEEADTIRRKVLVLQDEREKMSWELRKNFEFMSVEFDKMHELLKMLQDKMKRLADAYEQDSE